jgi:hypothetical protein
MNAVHVLKSSALKVYLLLSSSKYFTDCGNIDGNKADFNACLTKMKLGPLYYCVLPLLNYFQTLELV